MGADNFKSNTLAAFSKKLINYFYSIFIFNVSLIENWG